MSAPGSPARVPPASPTASPVASRLPKGARPPVGHSVDGNTSLNMKEPDSEAQYASYPTTPHATSPLRAMHRTPMRTGEKSFESPQTSISADIASGPKKKRGFAALFSKNEGWTPLPLRPIFWIPYVGLLVALAVVLEVMLNVSNDRNGWKVKGDVTDPKAWLHYAVILPPAIVAMGIVAIWAWTDIEIKKMQPYVDLIHGDSVAQRSILLDYTRTNNFISWIKAFYNRHFLVGAATILALVTLVFQPLAAALVTMRVVWDDEGYHTVHNRQAVGLNQNTDFNDLTSFLTAAGYASASILYDLGDIPFVYDKYTIGEFEVPSMAANGTALANTTAIKTNTGCQNAPVNMQQLGNGNWLNTATLNGCSLTFNVSKIATSLFGTSVAICDQSKPEGQGPDYFRPVMFWFFTYQPTAKASATICFPTFSLVEVSATVDLHAYGNVTAVKELGPFQAGASNFSQFANNVTALAGKPYNGIAFQFSSTPDTFVIQRANATQLQLPAAAFQQAKQDPAGFVASFDQGKFVQWSDRVYGTYLKLIAKSIYFLPIDLPVLVQVRTLQDRAFLSAPAVHILTIAFILVALGSLTIHVLHYQDRKDLVLKHEPGTLASAIYVGADTPFASLIADRENDRQVKDAIKQARFRLDPHRNKVMMAGEDGYEGPLDDTLGELRSPKPLTRGESLVATISGHKDRHSRRWSRPIPVRGNSGLASPQVSGQNSPTTPR